MIKHTLKYRKASLNLKGSFGVTNLKVCSQKIVPIFSFFVWAGTSPKGAWKPKVSQGNTKVFLI
jgi:hypothetical protein